MPLTLKLESIPSAGRHIEGQLTEDIFELSDSAIRSDGPLSYDLTVFIEDGNAILSGNLQAPFSLECTRCLNAFPFTAALTGYRAEFPLENAQIVDLTDQLREDILLALPGYPKCEQATGDGRTCPQAGNFDGSDRDKIGNEAGAGSSGRSEVWDVLDQLPKSDDHTS